ncbi:DUF397 domain-containing protein [Nocardia pseudobrasiliensis]|uniref:Uncharacterized protein DUF397 n=1 Tax=Nocardia pseudobrasiliensis TaxID=45979 RepID=A0A370IG83_9NOCA|nr:DUF397 domain-containing protein [Nocardia pseudobrasiliensis]RDI69161.1 uncharacterized protein DUF397 [Nocardia pseudobrasiliensis]
MTDPYTAVMAGHFDIGWRKSSFSGPDGHCVECARLTDGRVAVRNSNHPQAGTLLFTPAEWEAWVRGCRAGEFDDMSG